MPSEKIIHDTPVEKYAVIGDPIEHSRSPLIHNYFASSAKQKIHYTRYRVNREMILPFITDFFSSPVNKGLNVTAPLKEYAATCCPLLSKRASLAGAVNTIIVGDNGDLYGDNTDGVGFIRDLTINQNIALEGQSVLLIGAGGAAKGVAPDILKQNPGELIITNRTFSKAKLVQQDLKRLGNIRAEEIGNLDNNFDVVINATSTSLNGGKIDLPTNIISSETACYDMMYNKKITAFNSWALSLGARKTADGLGMLIEQAAESFFVFRGVKPETADILTSIKKYF